MDNLFEAADSGDVLAHPRITNMCIYIYIYIYIYILVLSID